MQSFLTLDVPDGDIDDEHVIELLETLSTQKESARTPAVQLSNLNTLITVLDQVQAYPAKPQPSTMEEDFVDGAGPTQIIDQDAKSLLLAGDEETYNTITQKIDQLTSHYGKLIQSSRPDKAKASQEVSKAKAKVLGSQRSVSYDTPKKSSLYSQSSKQNLRAPLLN